MPPVLVTRELYFGCLTANALPATRVLVTIISISGDHASAAHRDRYRPRTAPAAARRQRAPATCERPAFEARGALLSRCGRRRGRRAAVRLHVPARSCGSAGQVPARAPVRLVGALHGPDACACAREIHRPSLLVSASCVGSLSDQRANTRTRPRHPGASSGGPCRRSQQPPTRSS